MKRPVMFMVLAGLAAMLASVVVYSALKKREAEVQNAIAKNVNIVVAAYDLPLGTKIEPGELKLAKWSNDSLPEGAYRNPTEVIGSFVKGSFVAHEPIVASKLFIGQKTAGVMPLLIPYGMRAVSVQVDEVSDIAGFVLPHTRVDVLVALATAESGKPFSKVVLQNVEVLAVAQEVEMKKDEPQVVKVVTLLVSPHEAERLALASREGVLHLAMRNYNDNKIVLTSGSDVQRMLNAYSLQAEVPVMKPQEAKRAGAPTRPRAHPFEVEIYRNGKSSESMSFIHEASLGSGDKATARQHGNFDKVSAKSSSDDGDSESTASAGPEAPGGSAHPAGNAVRGASFSGAAPSYAPKPKTIDVP
jgi:pilus assembly protein CpaB